MFYQFTLNKEVELKTAPFIYIIHLNLFEFI